MEKLEAEIRELKRVLLAMTAQKEVAGVFESYSIIQEMLELEARLKLLEKLLAKGILLKWPFYFCTLVFQISEREKEEQAGGGRRRPTGAIEGPSTRKRHGDVDLTALRNVTAHNWLQDFELLEEHGGDAEDSISNYLKILDPVKKESLTRNTTIFETTALIQNFENASDPEGTLDKSFKSFYQQLFQAANALRISLISNFMEMQ